MRLRMNYPEGSQEKDHSNQFNWNWEFEDCGMNSAIEMLALSRARCRLDGAHLNSYGARLHQTKGVTPAPDKGSPECCTLLHVTGRQFTDILERNLTSSQKSLSKSE